MPELSIIVPVYKVEKYLPKCIDSILAQTFTDFELILIDDGSPDRCGEICDEYAAQDPRIRVIHQENQGVSAARNAGLDIATGTYIGFVDSDDWIEPEMYESLLEVAISKSALIVGCRVSYYYSENDISETEAVETCNNSELNSFNSDDLIIDCFSKPGKLMRFCVNKVFNRNFVKSSMAYFPTAIHVWEDFSFLLSLYLHYHKNYNGKEPMVFLLDTHLYCYRQRSGSATKTGTFSMQSNKSLVTNFLEPIRKTCPEYSLNAILFYFDSIIKLLRTSKKNSLILRCKLKISIAYCIILCLSYHCYERTAIHKIIYEGLIKG